MPNGEAIRSQHIWLHLLVRICLFAYIFAVSTDNGDLNKVFINPAVASLREHHHLFAEPGCFNGRAKKGENNKYNCGVDKIPGASEVESRIPDSFLALKLDKAMDDEWERLILERQ